MNSAEHVCHYALLRFMPYREAEEFVNIGVVLTCPEVGFLDFAVERTKFKRVTDFFPEFKPKETVTIYRDGLGALLREIERFSLQAQHDRRFKHFQAEQLRAAFLALTRPREAIFHFGSARTLLAPSPELALEQLFALYIERQLTHVPDSPEEHLRRRLVQWLAQSGLGRVYREEKIGTADYAVTFPFVAGPADAPPSLRRAIKPLNLAQQTTSDVYNHGDDWISRLRRLKRMDALPAATLFAVKQPPLGTPTQRAAAEIRAELADYAGVETLDFEATPRILEWAQLSQTEPQLGLETV